MFSRFSGSLGWVTTRLLVITEKKVLRSRVATFSAARSFVDDRLRALCSLYPVDVRQDSRRGVNCR